MNLFDRLSGLRLAAFGFLGLTGLGLVGLWA